jgi:hypothetical protein
MAPIIPDVVPGHFPAGTTVKFTRSFGDFQPSDGWAYTIYLNGLTQKFNKAATTENNVFNITFLPADTASLTPGPFRYAERVSNSGTGEVYDINGDLLVINIEPNVSASPAGTFNTWEERMLSIVESALAGRLPAGIESYQIAGRSVSKIPAKELMQIRGILKSIIWRQNNPGQLSQPYRVEFTVEPESPDFPPTWQDVTGLQQ